MRTKGREKSPEGMENSMKLKREGGGGREKEIQKQISGPRKGVGKQKRGSKWRWLWQEHGGK